MKKRIKQLYNLLKFAIVFPVALLCKLFIKNAWLICEDEFEARDNGYWLYKYIKEHYPKRNCHYAISKKSADFQKVKVLGNVVAYNSCAHWFWYIVCRCNISSQASGRPENGVARLLEKMGLVKNKFCFLQHGVIINDLKWLYAKRNKIDWFLTSALDEYNFIKEKFGYKDGVVNMLGLPRFDNLHDISINEDEILFMPTWRTWIDRPDATVMNSAGVLPMEKFEETEYYAKINELINHPALETILEKYNKTITFYPHRNAQGFLEYFDNKIKRVKICSRSDVDIQDLLKRCSMLITDYSSVFMDIVYMKKPILFYQFDEKKFRSGQYDEGYFDYHNNPYSIWAGDVNCLLDNLENLLSHRVKLNYDIEKLFPLYDSNNCERVYNSISKMFDKK